MMCRYSCSESGELKLGDDCDDNGSEFGKVNMEDTWIVDCGQATAHIYPVEFARKPLDKGD